MIISENPKFILFSVNKTGTSSMDDALAPYFDEAKYRKNLAQADAIRFPKDRAGRKINESIGELPWNVITKLKHASPSWVREHWESICPESGWSEFTKVCFVRNPYDRLLSIYSFHTQVLPHSFPKAVKAGSFEAWLELGGTGSAKKSMKEFVQDPNGGSLVDFIGRYENLEEDWKRFLAQVGIRKIELGRNPHTTSKHAKWDEVVTPKVKTIVKSNPTWAADLEYFGYL